MVFILSLIFSSPSLANDGPCSEQLPPASYVAMPAPAFELIRVSSHRELQQICGSMWTIFACAMNDRPVVYMMSDRFIAEKAGDFHKGRRWTACLITHEVAHLNGWRH